MHVDVFDVTFGNGGSFELAPKYAVSNIYFVLSLAKIILFSPRLIIFRLFVGLQGSALKTKKAHFLN